MSANASSRRCSAAASSAPARSRSRSISASRGRRRLAPLHQLELLVLQRRTAADSARRSRSAGSTRSLGGDETVGEPLCVPRRARPDGLDLVRRACGSRASRSPISAWASVTRPLPRSSTRCPVVAISSSSGSVRRRCCGRADHLVQARDLEQAKLDERVDLRRHVPPPRSHRRDATGQGVGVARGARRAPSTGRCGAVDTVVRTAAPNSASSTRGGPGQPRPLARPVRDLDHGRIAVDGDELGDDVVPQIGGDVRRRRRRPRRPGALRRPAPPQTATAQDGAVRIARCTDPAHGGRGSRAATTSANWASGQRFRRGRRPDRGPSRAGCAASSMTSMAGSSYGCAARTAASTAARPARGAIISTRVSATSLDAARRRR